MIPLSIIVPVYNKAEYLEDTVRSILSQTFRNFELILVNDGSTDGSGEMCRKYERLDQRVRVVEQANSGVSSARNKGVELAEGLYCGFVDADDLLEPDMYEILIENALESNADISGCGIKAGNEDHRSENPVMPVTTVLDQMQALRLNLKGDLYRNVTNKIYRTAIVSAIQFEGNIYEDILYTCKAFIAADKTVYTTAQKYHYVTRENSVSNSKFNDKYLETIEVSAEIVKLVRLDHAACLNEAKAFDVVANISLLNLLLLARTSFYSTVYDRVVGNLKRYEAFIRASSHVRKKHKYAVKLFFFSPSFYRTSMYMYCRLTNSDVINRS